MCAYKEGALNNPSLWYCIINFYRLYDNKFSERGEEEIKAAAEKRNENEDMANLSLC